MGAVVMTNADDGVEVALELVCAIAHEYAWPEYAPQRVAASINARVYDAYSGEYEARPGLAMAVTTREDVLLLQAAGQEPIALYPSSEATFFSPVVNSEVTFIKDGGDAVTGLTLRQEAQETLAKKLR